VQDDSVVSANTRPYFRRHLTEHRIEKLNAEAARLASKRKSLKRDPVLPVTFSQHSRSALHYCVNHGHTQCALLLLDHPTRAVALVRTRDDRHETALHRAAWNDNSLVAVRLIQLGADVNACNMYVCMCVCMCVSVCVCVCVCVCVHLRFASDTLFTHYILWISSIL
jgi:ankyrin repeat protein